MSPAILTVPVDAQVAQPGEIALDQQQKGKTIEKLKIQKLGLTMFGTPTAIVGSHHPLD